MTTGDLTVRRPTAVPDQPRRGGRRTAPGAPTPPGGAIAGRAMFLTLTTIVVSGANYLFALLMIRLLGTAAYVQYVSVQSVLLVLGTGGMAAIPWAVAHHVAVARTPRAAGEALRFGLLASTIQGAVFAVVAGAVVVPVSGWPLGATTAAAAFALSVVAAPIGLLQGRERLASIAWLRLAETAVRIGTSLVLVGVVASSAVSPVAGFVAGSVSLFGLAMWLCRGAFPLARATAEDLRRLLVRSLKLGAAQATLASIGVIDTVVIGMTQLSARAASGYQVAALLGRVPLFLSTAVALSYYPSMAAAGSDDAARVHSVSALRLFARLGIPAALLVATLPPVVIDVLAPGRDGDLRSVLPATAVIGLLIGLLTVLTTWQQARDRFGSVLRVLGPIALVQPVLLIVAGRHRSVIGYALTGVALVAVAYATVVWNIGVQGWGRILSRGDALLLLTGAVLVVGSHWTPLLWAAAALPLAVVSARVPFGGRRRPGTRRRH